jgi:hypothetical protein
MNWNIEISNFICIFYIVLIYYVFNFIILFYRYIVIM